MIAKFLFWIVILSYLLLQAAAVDDPPSRSVPDRGKAPMLEYVESSSSAAISPDERDTSSPSPVVATEQDIIRTPPGYILPPRTEYQEKRMVIRKPSPAALRDIERRYRSLKESSHLPVDHLAQLSGSTEGLKDHLRALSTGDLVRVYHSQLNDRELKTKVVEEMARRTNEAGDAAYRVMQGRAEGEDLDKAALYNFLYHVTEDLNFFGLRRLR